MKNSSDNWPVRQYNSLKEAELWLWAHKDYIGRFTCIKDGQVLLNNAIGCHSPIRCTRNVKSLITAIGDNKYLKRYMRYLTRSDGVFASLFKHEGWEYIADGERIFGLVVPDALVKDESIPWPLTYAFLIESRMFHEFKWQLDVWDLLVKQGADGKLAHVLSRYLALEKEVLIRNPGPQYSWNGAHTIFSDYGGRTNFSLFLDGKYLTQGIEVSSPTSRLWNDKDTRVTPLSDAIQWNKFGKKVKIESNFGPIQYKHEIPISKAKELCDHALEVIKRRA